MSFVGSRNEDQEVQFPKAIIKGERASCETIYVSFEFYGLSK